MKFFIVVSLLTLHNQVVTPQMVLPPPYNFINRPIGEQMIETGNFINQLPPTVISESPCNNMVPIPNVAAPPSTIITDCSPEICQNLANTIQLLIVSNLLQNNLNSDVRREFAAPILKEIMSLPILSCGCSNPLSPNVIPPNIPTPHFSPNVITNYMPNIYPPNFVNPNLVSPTHNVISPNMYEIISPTNPCPNSPQQGPANVNGLLNTIMSILGNIQG